MAQVPNVAPIVSSPPADRSAASALPTGAAPRIDTSPAEDIIKAADYRLVIEKDPIHGSYIYKTIDRVTGKIINQLPREELLRVRDDPAYVAGKVISTGA